MNTDDRDLRVSPDFTDFIRFYQLANRDLEEIDSFHPLRGYFMVIRLERNRLLWDFFSKETMIHFGMQLLHTDLFIFKEYL